MSKQKTQKEEMQLASKEHRQPICIYCGHPIDEVIHYQTTVVKWRFTGIKFIRIVSDYDDIKPFHNCNWCNCELEDSGFVVDG